MWWERTSPLQGVYPNVMDYTVNFRNKRETTAQDVTVSMQLSEDDAKFPLKSTTATMTAPLSACSREKPCPLPQQWPYARNSYTGYYPIKYTITFPLKL